MPHARIERKKPQEKTSGTRLSPQQLRALADRMLTSDDPAEIARLKKEMERGFYGDPEHG